MTAGLDIRVLGVPAEKKYIDATTDAQGHYRLEGLDANVPQELEVIPPAGSAYLPEGDRVTVKLDERELTKDFQLRQGVLMRRRAVDDRTGQGVLGQVQYLTFADDAETKKAYPGLFRFGVYDVAHSDANGSFAIGVPPGRGVIAFTADDQTRFRRGVGENALTVASAETPNGRQFRTMPGFFANSFHLVHEINPTAEVLPPEITLSLTSGANVVGKIVDPDGKPLSGAMMSGQVLYRGWLTNQDDTFRVEGYYPDLARELFFYHPERNLAGYFKLEGPPPKEVIVKLQPAAAARGLLVDGQQRPITNCLIQGVGVPSENFGEADPHPADADGRFEIHGLVPGRKYTLIADGGMAKGFPGLGNAVIDVDAAPGQIKNLGDVTLQKPESPKPAMPKGDGKAASTPGASGSASGATGSASAAQQPAGKMVTATSAPKLQTRPRKALA